MCIFDTEYSGPVGTTINVLIIFCAKNMQQGAKIVMENNKKVGEILAVILSENTFAK